MAQEKFTTSEKMVRVGNHMVPLSKRQAAMALGDEIAAKKEASFAESRNRDIKELREANWSEDDIKLYLNAQEAEVAASHGFIEPTTSSRRTTERHVVPYGPGLMFH